MPIFKRKPEFVEANLFDGSVGSREEIVTWIKDNGGQVDKCREVITDQPAMTLKTMAGYATVRKDNYIIKHNGNNFSFMHKDIFDIYFEQELTANEDK